MKGKAVPYIGISDFNDSHMAEVVRSCFELIRPDGLNRRLHIGVMMSYKTLYGCGSKWQKVFPTPFDIERIFGIVGDKGTMNCLHLVDYDNMPKLRFTIVKAICSCGPFLNAIQLDMIWPDPKEISEALGIIVGTDNKRVDEVILQVGARALDVVDNEPLKLVERLRPYEGIVQYILLDKSMGRGHGMDANILLPFIREIKNSGLSFEIVVAGGLGPGTMSLVQPIAKEFPDVSIDAQGKLRPSGSALDPLNFTYSMKYLIEALDLFNACSA